jgi:hypothetical protein
LQIDAKSIKLGLKTAGDRMAHTIVARTILGNDAVAEAVDHGKDLINRSIAFGICMASRDIAAEDRVIEF